MKQIEVRILGQNYLLGCPPDGDAALLEAVRVVDREMTAIREAGRVKARERIAVLAALNLAYALSQAQGQAATDASRPLASQQAGSHDQEHVHAAWTPDDLARIQGQAPGADGQTVDSLVERLDDMLQKDGRLL